MERRVAGGEAYGGPGPTLWSDAKRFGALRFGWGHKRGMSRGWGLWWAGAHPIRQQGALRSAKG